MHHSIIPPSSGVHSVPGNGNELDNPDFIPQHAFLPSAIPPSMASLGLQANMLRAQSMLAFPPGLGIALNPLYAVQQQQLLAARAAAAVLNPFGRGLGFPYASLGTPQMPRPMIVPSGMNAALNIPIWSEHKAEDGRVFYYNRESQQSTWTKPDELRTSAERASSSFSSNGGWRVYTTAAGRKYYHNKCTKETTWTKPAGFGGEDKDELKNEGKNASKEESEMDRAVAATLAALPDPELELKERKAERFAEMLRDKYTEGKITMSCTWDRAVPFLQADPRFRILSRISEKKQLFHAWRVRRQKEERDEKRLAARKAKEDLEGWLLEHPKMRRRGFKYRRADELFEDEGVWLAVEDDERREIFRDAHEAVMQKMEEEKEEKARRNVEALRTILESMSGITHRTTWAQAQRMLIENAEFVRDETLQGMDEMDALVVFEKHIRHVQRFVAYISRLEKEHEDEKEEEEKRVRREERKAREAFEGLLKELHEKGELTSISLWISLYTSISSDARFEMMLQQNGSTPLDLFKFYVEELKARYGTDRQTVREILEQKGLSIGVGTTFDEVVECVRQHERGMKVDLGNLKLCFNSLVEKAANKEMEREKKEEKEKKVEGCFIDQ